MPLDKKYICIIIKNKNEIDVYIVYKDIHTHTIKSFIYTYIK
jgi:hypothetical protein